MVRVCRRRAGMKLALVVLISVLVLLPATASAQLGQMPIYRLSPASGSTLSLLPAYGATRVVFQSAPTSYFDMITGITFEVASQNVMGRDGTLSDDFNVDYDYIHAGDTDPSVYVDGVSQLQLPGPHSGHLLLSVLGLYVRHASAPGEPGVLVCLGPDRRGDGRRRSRVPRAALRTPRCRARTPSPTCATWSVTRPTIRPRTCAQTAPASRSRRSDAKRAFAQEVTRTRGTSPSATTSVATARRSIGPDRSSGAATPEPWSAG